MEEVLIRVLLLISAQFRTLIIWDRRVIIENTRRRSTELSSKRKTLFKKKVQNINIHAELHDV